MDKVLDPNSVNELKSLIEFEGVHNTEAGYKSTDFKLREELFRDLFDSLENDIPDRINLSELPTEVQQISKDSSTQSYDKIILQGWKNIENISARLVEFSLDHVVLECLIDKENKIYEERIFRPSLFNNYKLVIGNLFYLRFFERQNEIRMEVHDDPDLTFRNDFPKLDFVSEFKDSKLFRKKK